MKLPQLHDPTRYAGLYVVNFGDQAAVGYTGREVETLLDHEAYRECKVYKIHRASPDGTLELKGVSAARFSLEEGMLFHRSDERLARQDFAVLEQLAADVPPPCRAKCHLKRLNGDGPAFVVALIYPAEYSDEISRWLADADYRGGDFVEGGAAAVTRYYEMASELVLEHQFWGAQDADARPAEELLATTHVAVQR